MSAYLILHMGPFTISERITLDPSPKQRRTWPSDWAQTMAWLASTTEEASTRSSARDRKFKVLAKNAFSCFKELLAEKLD